MHSIVLDSRRTLRRRLNPWMQTWVQRIATTMRPAVLHCSFIDESSKAWGVRVIQQACVCFRTKWNFGHGSAKTVKSGAPSGSTGSPPQGSWLTRIRPHLVLWAKGATTIGKTPRSQKTRPVCCPAFRGPPCHRATAMRATIQQGLTN